MDYQVNHFRWRYKLFCWQNNGKCLIVVARGNMDRLAFLRVIREIVEVTRSFDTCKVLLNLQNVTCDLGLDDLVESKLDLEIDPQTVAGKLKLAMLMTPIPEHYDRLSLLKVPVSKLGIEVGVFYEEKRSIDWLAKETGRGFS